MGYFVYRFFNIEGEIIYIGKTVRVSSRLRNEHFTKNGHLDTAVYREAIKVEYAKLVSKDEMNIYERYLINRITPKYNNQMNNNSQFRFDLPELKWESFDISKEKLLDNYGEDRKRRASKRDTEKLHNLLFKEAIEEQKQLRTTNFAYNNTEDISTESNKGYLYLETNDVVTMLEIPHLPRFRHLNTGDKWHGCRYAQINGEMWYCAIDFISLLEVNNWRMKMPGLIRHNRIEPTDFMYYVSKNERKGGTSTTMELGNSHWLKAMVDDDMVQKNRCRKEELDKWEPIWKFIYRNVLGIDNAETA